MVDLSVVIVSWNVEGLLRACLRSVADELAGASSDQALSAEVFVVDNASSDRTVDMVASEFPHVKLIANQANVGFTRGNNQALQQARGRYVCLLNPDCEILPGALRRMIDYADAHPEVGAIGPQLLFADGSIQSSRRRFPTLRTGFLESTILQRWFPHSRAIQEYYCSDRVDDTIQEVDWLVGACLMLRREALDQVGLLDEGFFMYSEELDWCYRAKTAGWRVFYLPLARVVHHEGKSSEQNLVDRNTHFHDSKCRFFSKHHGAWQGFLLRLFIFLTFLYQIVEESAKFIVVARNRQMRRSRLSMLAQASRHQLKTLLRGS